MDYELLKMVASLGGIGGVFGMVIFFIYRQDKKETIKQIREDRIYMEDRLTQLMRAMEDRYTLHIGTYNTLVEERTKAVIANTAVTSELITYLKTKNGSG